MAAKRVKLLPEAEQDVDEESVYLAQEASAEVGIRFYDAAHESFRELLDMPGIGKVKEVNNPKLSDIRQWQVSGFENYLIFYRVFPGGIEIMRVLHGARNIDHILERETGEE